MQIEELVSAQRAFFNTGATKDAAFRRRALAALRQAVTAREADICAALKEDLHKSPFESYMCETGLVLSELTYMEKHLNRLMRARRAKTPLAQFPARSFVVPEPLGVALVMSPWNYPFMLSLDPLVGAIAAGNCAVLKPSAYAPATSRVLKELVESCFAPDHIAVVEGGRAENEALLEQKFDYIFFTGSVAVGRLVMEKAARWLTPVTLELGGKSPCIIDQTADLPLAAKRLAFGKYLNAGQTCVAPDYLLVHRDLKEGLCREMKHAVGEFFGDYPLRSPAYPRIVSERATARLAGMIGASGRVLWGGEFDVRQRYVAPTLIDNPDDDSPAMTEEIFGPLLPVKTFRHIDEAIGYVNRRDKPLALYYFGDRREAERVLDRTSSGGACVNDTIVHLANGRLPFGGVGESGFGKYHGRSSFDLFSHMRPVVRSSRLIDLPLKYAPYRRLKLYRKLFR